MQGRYMMLTALLAVTAFGRSTGAPPGRTGAPPGDNCTGCHGGTVNSGPGSVRIEFAGGSTYTPGQTYKVRVTVSDPNAVRWGFQVTARMGSDKTTRAGTFAVDNATTTQFSPGGTAGEYVTHTAAARRRERRARTAGK